MDALGWMPTPTMHGNETIANATGRRPDDSRRGRGAGSVFVRALGRRGETEMVVVAVTFTGV